jgi:L-serine deaminase
MSKLPVSLQSVLRALIEEGLKRDGHAALRVNVEGQARAVQHRRRMARRDKGEGK